MRVLLGWSGIRSKAVAEVLRTWLPEVIQAVSPWVSSQDIAAGARWQASLSAQLQDADFGVICTTPENVSEPWISFEAGAVSKESKSPVCPYLLDMCPKELDGTPLAQFQMAAANEDGTRSLVAAMNAAMGTNALSGDSLESQFKDHWPRLSEKLEEIRLSSRPIFAPSHAHYRPAYGGGLHVLIVDDEYPSARVWHACFRLGA